MVILQDPHSDYRVVVTTKTEKYNLLALGYTDVSAQVVTEVVTGLKSVEKAGKRGAEALKVLKDAATDAGKGHAELGEVVDDLGVKAEDKHDEDDK